MLITLYLDGTPIETRYVPTVNLTIEGYYRGLQYDMIEQNEEIIDFTNKAVEFILSEELPKKGMAFSN